MTLNYRIISPITPSINGTTYIYIIEKPMGWKSWDGMFHWNESV